ncbi:MAG: dTDP-glucose 4,6-dehydratase [Polyangiales bacterium]
MAGTIVVTGGAGFIGSNFVRRTLARGHERVVVFDKLTYAGNLESLADFERDPRFGFVQGDISDGNAVRAFVEALRPTAIVNFAAETHVDRSIDGPRAFVETNIVGTFELLDACRRHLTTVSASERAAFRFLHISTDEVYGSLGETGAFHETTPYAPSSPYSASKASADHLVHAYGTTYGVPVLITNCSNNYGPYQFPEKLVPLMILNALEGKRLPIYGDGKNVRDWLFVEDHCDAIARVLEAGRLGEKYNVGGNSERSNVEIVDTICASLEALVPARENTALRASNVASYAALKTYVADRPGHDRRYAIDATKVTSELGWKPAHSFAEGLARTVRWYLDHRGWCDAVQAGKYRRERLGLTSAEATQ